MPTHLIQPYGGSLVQLFVGPERRTELQASSRDWLSHSLTRRQLGDLELLLNGGFSPLKGFMSRADYESVCDSLQLTDGTVWPIPITLDVEEELAHQLSPGAWLALRDPEGVMLAALVVEDIWRPDRKEEAQKIYGTVDRTHPGASYLLQTSHPYYVTGRLEGIELPRHYDFRRLRHTPAQLRTEFARLGWRRVVAFHTRAPLHRAQYEITLQASTGSRANLLIHPVTGVPQPGDLNHYTRVRCYEAVLSEYPTTTVMLSLLPLSMRMAGPREAVWHGIIRRNYGCAHLIVGHDHAGPTGKPWYEPHAAQELMKRYESAIGVRAIPFKKMAYVEELDTYVSEEQAPKGARTLGISDDEMKQRLELGREIPTWFTFPAVAEAFRRTHPPRHKKGFTLFFTGLSGAGKSTIANVLRVKFLEMGGRPVTLLDGDIVRKNLSSELGFSKEHRDINIRRIGFVASEITKNGGIAICAPIAPYESVRDEVRQLIERRGSFVLVYVATPLNVCEDRDRKGMYAKARAGLIKEFTGISDPYEVPKDANVIIDTSELTPEEAAQDVILYLEQQGFINSGKQ